MLYEGVFNGTFIFSVRLCTLDALTSLSCTFPTIPNTPTSMLTGTCCTGPPFIPPFHARRVRASSGYRAHLETVFGANIEGVIRCYHTGPCAGGYDPSIQSLPNDIGVYDRKKKTKNPRLKRG
jgi:hypothetical protein